MGNARVNWRANGTAVTFLEELHYYPFGMLMEGIGTAAVTVNAYKYNSKELNTDLGLNWSDYGARWYDASVGRWWSVDPMNETTVDISSYAYVLNNPIILIDPTGMFAVGRGEDPEAYRLMKKEDEKRKEAQAIYQRVAKSAEEFLQKDPIRKVRITVTGEIATDEKGNNINGLQYAYPDRYPSSDDAIVYSMPLYKMTVEGIEIDENGDETVKETLNYLVFRFGVKYDKRKDETPRIVSIEDSKYFTSHGSEYALTWSEMTTTLNRQGWNIKGPYFLHVGPSIGRAMGSNGCIEISGGDSVWREFQSNIRRLSGVEKLTFNTTYNNITLRFLAAAQPPLVDSGKKIKK